MNFHNKSINPFRLQKLIRPIQPFLLQALLVSSSHIYLTFLSMLTFLFTLATNNSLVKGKQACTVRLPYSSVPGMDFSSRAYAKALATLAKQVHKDHNAISCFTCSKSSDDNSMDIGMSFSFSPVFLFFLTFLCADKPASSTSKIDASLAPISQPEFDTIRRARDTISNTVMVDLINEDADSSETSYRNSLRRQILDGCASLRVNLISIDRLMECFNKSITIARNSTSSSGSAGSQVD